jgi:hypothetical protein
MLLEECVPRVHIIEIGVGVQNKGIGVLSQVERERDKLPRSTPTHSRLTPLAVLLAPF